jgi:hypothetical protein
MANKTGAMERGFNYNKHTTAAICTSTDDYFTITTEP